MGRRIIDRKACINRVAVPALCAVLLLAGCSSDNTSLKTLDTSLYVTLCDYDVIPIDLDEPSVSDEELEETLEEYIENCAGWFEIERTTVEEGDWVNIDYTVYLSDGEEVEYAGNTGFYLEIGSDTMMDEIEDGLIGKESGETVAVEVTFPDDYTFEEAAGEEGYYEITINEIAEYLTFELTDKDVAFLGIDGVETVDDLRSEVYDALYEDAVEEYEYDAETLAFNYVVDNSEMILYPEEMYESYYEDMYEYYSEYAEYYGMELDEFLSEYAGIDGGEEALEEEALYYVKQLVVMQAVANAEGLNPTDDEIQEMLEYYGYESMDDFESYGGTEEDLHISAMAEKVYEFLGERAVSN